MMYEGRLILITGASSGIGEGFARELHKRGANLLLVARRGERLKRIADQLNLTRTDSVRFLTCDLSSEEDSEGRMGLKSLLRVISSEPVDILINNAGRGTFGEFEANSISDEIALISLNIVAFTKIAHAILPGMRKRGRGGILNVSSIAAFQPIPFMAVYAASKAYNFNFSLALRSELSGSGISVTALCPGPVGTEFGEVAKVPGNFKGMPHASVEKVVKKGLRGLENNTSFVVPGYGASMLAFLSRWIPERISIWITKQLLKNSARQVSSK